MKVKAIEVKSNNPVVMAYRMKEVQKVMANLRQANVPEIEIQAMVRAYWQQRA